jgi:hypothetical protein
MSKVINSSFEKWSGSVTIADPITIPQAQLIEAAMRRPDVTEGERVWLSVIDAMQLPAIMGCVEKWELSNMPENITAENFPASPRAESHKLISWLFREISNVWRGDIEIPNV